MRGYLSRARCILSAYGPADVTASQNPLSSLASFKSRLVLPFCNRFTRVVLERRLLNGCTVVVVVVVDSVSGLGRVLRLRLI